MNIFVTYPDPFLSAMVLDDVRANKMILESAQIYATALRLNGFEGDNIPKATHVDHPCVKWAARSRCNADWLMCHWFALMARFKTCREKPHAYEEYITTLSDNRKLIPAGDFYGFVNCTPYKKFPIHIAYRLSLLEKWRNDTIPLSWRGKSHTFITWAQVESQLVENIAEESEQIHKLIMTWTPKEMKDERNSDDEFIQVKGDS